MRSRNVRNWGRPRVICSQGSTFRRRAIVLDEEMTMLEQVRDFLL